MDCFVRPPEPSASDSADESGYFLNFMLKPSIVRCKQTSGVFSLVQSAAYASAAFSELELRKLSEPSPSNTRRVRTISNPASVLKRHDEYSPLSSALRRQPLSQTNRVVNPRLLSLKRKRDATSDSNDFSAVTDESSMAATEPNRLQRRTTRLYARNNTPDDDEEDEEEASDDQGQSDPRSADTQFTSVSIDSLLCEEASESYRSKMINPAQIQGAASLSYEMAARAVKNMFIDTKLTSDSSEDDDKDYEYRQKRSTGRHSLKKRSSNNAGKPSEAALFAAQASASHRGLQLAHVNSGKRIDKAAKGLPGTKGIENHTGSAEDLTDNSLIASK